MLIHDFIYSAQARHPEHQALTYGSECYTYSRLAAELDQTAAGLVELGLQPNDRVAIYLEKTPQTVMAMFAATRAGGVFVPINPLLKAEQVAHILRDCSVTVLVTSATRLAALQSTLSECPNLESVIITDRPETAATSPRLRVLPWQQLSTGFGSGAVRRIDTDMAAILYTSGSTGRPKGVVLSHRNLVAGAESVSTYLCNQPSDRILAALPFSFDYGLSQVTTAFRTGATAVLMNYLLPRDILRTVEKEAITGLAGVPPLWIQLAELDWPAAAASSLRYITNTGGSMPTAVVTELRRKLPSTQVYLMYGLTEAFRSTFLPPEQVDKRPDSIGQAIPNAEILVVRGDGSTCEPGEPGELVHRGALVAMGYWGDPDKTAERFRPAPGQPDGLPFPEIAVWSGDTVRKDDEGYLYFVGRRDEMIKTSGYRVSPNEVEEVIYSTGQIAEACAFGVPHPRLGQAIVLVCVPRDPGLDLHELTMTLRERLPPFMQPAHLATVSTALPRNANGKIDRKALAPEYAGIFEKGSA